VTGIVEVLNFGKIAVFARVTHSIAMYNHERHRGGWRSQPPVRRGSNQCRSTFLCARVAPDHRHRARRHHVELPIVVAVLERGRFRPSWTACPCVAGPAGFAATLVASPLGPGRRGPEAEPASTAGSLMKRHGSRASHRSTR
jgi:hypothetical protein